MTNRTMDSGSSRMGGDEADLDIDELFAASRDGGREDEATDQSATREGTDGRDEIEDTTAGELFQQLSAEVADESDEEEEDDPFAAFSDESPEEIIASADEEVEHVDEIDESIAADDELFDTLLLPDREEQDGFLWVQTDADEAEPASATDDAPADTASNAAETDALDEDGFSFDVDDATSSSDGPVWGDTAEASTEEPAETAAAPESTDVAEEETTADDGETPEIDSGATLSATFDDGDVQSDDEASDAVEVGDEPVTADTPHDAADETGDIAADTGEADITTDDTDDTDTDEADTTVDDTDTDDADTTATDADDADETDDDDDSGGGGIASKIRSILSS